MGAKVLKLINVKLAIVIILSGLVGAIIGAKISVNVDSESLKKYFGIFLLLIACNEIYSLIKMYILLKKTHTN